MLFAYFSPDVTLPVASILAGAFGFILMVGRAPFRFVGRLFRGNSRKPKTGAKNDEP
jgi:hypothetical protein